MANNSGITEQKMNESNESNTPKKKDWPTFKWPTIDFEWPEIDLDWEPIEWEPLEIDWPPYD